MAIEKPKLEIGTSAGRIGTIVDVRAQHEYLMESPSGERMWYGEKQVEHWAHEAKPKVRAKRAAKKTGASATLMMSLEPVLTKGRKFTGLDATSAKIAAMAEARGDHETAAKIRENVAGT